MPTGFPKHSYRIDEDAIRDAEIVAQHIKARSNWPELDNRRLNSYELLHILNMPKSKGAYIRKLINYLRAGGEPICADGRGYFWAKNQEELLQSINSLQERATAIMVARAGLMKAYNNKFNGGQMELIKG